MFGRIGRRIYPKISVGKTLSTSEYVITKSRHSLVRCNKLILQPSSYYQPIAWFSSESKPEAAQDVQNSSQDEEEAVEDEDYTLELTDEEIEKLTGGDPELIKKIKYIQLEHEVHRQEGMNVPSRIRMSEWKEILELDSPGKRRRYYNFLFLNEMKSVNFKAKKQQKREDRFRELEESGNLWGPKGDDQFGVTYGLGRNTLFLRLYDSTVAKFHHSKVVSAMQFGRPLVLDCGYDEFMSPREAKNCAKQVEILITLNRTHNQPFNLHLCNVAPDSRLMGYLEKIVPTIHDEAYPLHVTEQSYLDIFPKKELIYLSPHAKEELEEYDENEIYIIGGMVDKSDPRPFSLAKAKKENVRMKKLPLDKYLVWGMGNKSLTLNQMISIMLDLRLYGDWKKAFDHVPKRKLNRDYHPYPNQIEDRQFEHQSSFQQSPRRREQKSQVLEDFDLQNRRHKGFKGNASHENYAVRSNNYPSREYGRNNNRINARSLFEKE